MQALQQEERGGRDQLFFFFFFKEVNTSKWLERKEMGVAFLFKKRISTNEIICSLF